MVSSLSMGAFLGPVLGCAPGRGLSSAGPGKWRRPAVGASHRDPCPYSFYFAPRQLNIRHPCLAGPQTTAHGRKGTQPQMENNSWERAELGGPEGRGAESSRL